MQELEAEVDASKRALKAAEMAAATSAERAAEAECEARELRSHLAGQREKVANLEVGVRSVRARNDAPAPAASAPHVENKEEKAKDQAERAELRKRVMELEKDMEAQKQMHAQVPSLIDTD